MKQDNTNKKSYYELLRDPRWQKKRLEIMSRDNFSCTSCEGKDKQLHVHDLHYIRGNDPWDCPNNLLITLCEDCHKEYEKHSRNIGDTLVEQLACAGLSGDDIIDIYVSIYNILNCDRYRQRSISMGDLIANIILDKKAMDVAMRAVKSHMKKIGLLI